MKKTLLILILLSSSLPLRSRGTDSLSVVFWNVENFFDWKSEGPGMPDYEFSAAGRRHWTKRRFYAKCNAIAKTLLRISEGLGRFPDAVCFAEVENAFVVRQLTSATVLRKLDYKVVHYESPDRRGIDCALIYRASRLHKVSSAPKHVYDSLGAVMKTRDILLCEFRTSAGPLAILVNHHPSKVGGGKQSRREAAMGRMTQLCDSLEAAGCRRILCVGDFNDDLWHSPEAQGTIKYNGVWEKIDGYFARGLPAVREFVHADPLLTVPDAGFGGTKPLRTYSGPRYLGGVSDHCPIVEVFADVTECEKNIIFVVLRQIKQSHNYAKQDSRQICLPLRRRRRVFCFCRTHQPYR